MKIHNENLLILKDHDNRFPIDFKGEKELELHTVSKDLESVKIVEKLKIEYRKIYLINYYRYLITNCHQPQGASPNAGMRQVGHRTKTGRDISRQPRTTVGGGGSRVVNVPNAVGGRRCHPPRANKNFKIELNKKEKSKFIHALFSAAIAHSKIILIDDEINLNIKTLNQILDRETETKNYLSVEKSKKAGTRSTGWKKYSVKTKAIFITNQNDDLRLKNLKSLKIITPTQPLYRSLFATFKGDRTLLFRASVFNKLKDSLNQ